MKRLLIFLLPVLAFAASVNDVKVPQLANASPPAYADRFITPVQLSLWGFDSSFRPFNVTLGSNLSMTAGGVLNATGGGGGGDVTDVTASLPLLSSGGTTPNISIPVATSSVSGYLSNTDWSTFNGKVPTTRTVNGQPLSGDVTITTITGNAGTATELQSARTIGGVSFNGTANIVPETIAVVTGTDTTSSVLIVDSTTGSLQPKTDAGITYNASDDNITVTGDYISGSSGRFTKSTSVASIVASLFHYNPNTGTNASAYAATANANGYSASTHIITYGTGYTTDGARKQDGGALFAGLDLTGGLTVGTLGNYPVYFAVNDAVVGTLDASGLVLTGSISPSASTVTWTAGAGSPESVVTAPVGSIYSQTDGGAGTTFWVKESGTGNTGWDSK